ncbi:MAG: hypothetical protein JPMHGGIA_00869 [Saprospiraceae bacterium]|jgi:DNA-binding transcriptional MerR regulator|nr:hypothetical protein [Saprospiraceae bacterium]
MLYPAVLYPYTVLAIYSIADLEMLTGIKAHTIRIWEKRYALITPKRTHTNIRYYTDDDLRRLANIALLNQQGVKISLLSGMPAQEIESRVADINSVEVFNRDALDALTLSILQLNDKNFTHLVNTNINQLGFDQTLEQILMPLLDKLNAMWLTGSFKKVHEEFVSRIIKKKIIQELRKFETQEVAGDASFLLFQPHEEKQELNQLFVELFIRKNHLKVIDLGGDLLVSDLLDAIQIARPKFLFTIAHEKSSVDYISDLVSALGELNDPPILLLTGYCANQFADQTRFVRVTEGFEDLEKFIQAVREMNGAAGKA